MVGLHTYPSITGLGMPCISEDISRTSDTFTIESLGNSYTWLLATQIVNITGLFLSKISIILFHNILYNKVVEKYKKKRKKF